MNIRHFDIEMGDLQSCLLDMTKLVQEMIKAAAQELVERDLGQVDVVLCLERKVDIQEMVIDHKCLGLIALNQPVGADLRFITSAMKISSDLERMGDEAASISRMALDLIKYPELKPLIDIPKMVENVQNMITNCIRAFNTSDPELASSVLAGDSEVDFLRDRVTDDIKEVLLKSSDMDTVQRAIDLMFIAKSIERIGDHATNISEDIIFMVRGEDVRHPRACE
ncbi:phosphate transport system regulatory protein PhoU [Endomicrobiia bacterium]|nr:phosphate transport system regulatory protein PhoU [Endomicrobiia bacterium]GHT64214.1 phosphate transport system regulatory protein PhoU [Endomicrobiia bacterium]GHT70334.1 phosphate transport system regulatory protein PhoU [Endomicrobiia bacterium]GHT73876.1 phosphate transport system regulatory protein PhoU [Endomicrobiia bacterium]